MPGDELRRQWERRRLDRWAHVYVSEASRRYESVKLHGVMERRRGSCHGAGLGAQVSRQRISEGRVVRCIADGAPNREGQPTSDAKNTMHLPECVEAIGEELHTLLTEDHIEDIVLER
jgi:hypothetical protein